MSRWIDADALIDRLDYCVKEGMGSTIAFTFKHMVEDAPTIEPKRGEWIEHRDNNGKTILWQCSECGLVIFSETETDRLVNHKWCSRCGADMRGKDDVER